MVTVFHHTPVNAVLFFKQFDWLYFDDLAGKHQKHQNAPPRHTILHYMVCLYLIMLLHTVSLHHKQGCSKWSGWSGFDQTNISQGKDKILFDKKLVINNCFM